MSILEDSYAMMDVRFHIRLDKIKMIIFTNYFYIINVFSLLFLFNMMMTCVKLKWRSDNSYTDPNLVGTEA